MLCFSLPPISVREFLVSVDNQHSTKADIKSGVLQGSILDPFLFILYMNGLSLHLDETQYVFR